MLDNDTTSADFLQAICANPADDAVRLVLADHLDEIGDDARAEFIRLQCELANWQELDGRVRSENWHRCCMSYSSGTEDLCVGTDNRRRDLCEYHALRRRERELLGKFGIQWLRSEVYSKLPDPSAFEKGFDFRRGFVEHISCSCADFLTHGPHLFTAAPVTAVRLVGKEPSNPGNGFVWHPLDSDWGRSDLPSHIPRPLFDLLLDGEVDGYAPNILWRVWWGTQTDDAAKAAAHAALSAACVTWARRKAKLPPLPMTLAPAAPGCAHCGMPMLAGTDRDVCEACTAQWFGFS